MRKYRSRRYKKSYNIKFLWLGILFLVALGALFYAVFLSSFFQIKEIRISGNEKVLTEEIAGFFGSGNILFFDADETSRIILEKFQKIANLNIKKELPDILIVQIEERKPVAVFFKDENYFFIDQEGVIFEKISELPKDALIIKGDEKFVQKERIEKILKINSNLKDDLGVPLEEILIISETKLNAKTLEGWEIYFNLEGDLDWQLEELAVVLKEKIPSEERGNLEYIDLRFDKIYIFPKTY